MSLVKRIIGIMCAKNGKNTSTFVKVIPEKLNYFFGHGVLYLANAHSDITEQHCYTHKVYQK